jgi:DNA-binding NarL/FixJ family response regulator
MPKIKCLLTDDHTLFRQGVRRLLETESSDFEVVGEAADAGQAVEKARELRPDVVLMDIGMQGLSSFEAARQIRKNRPETKVLFLTMYDDEDYLVQCLEAGAAGYVLKDTPAPQLLAAVRDVYKGGKYLSSQVLGKLVEDFPVAGARYEVASAHQHTDAARARDPEVSGRRQFGERDRGHPWPEREDGGGAQVQPDAQAGHPQQGAIGDVRDPEEDHQDPGQRVIRRKAPSAFRSQFEA